MFVLKPVIFRVKKYLLVELHYKKVFVFFARVIFDFRIQFDIVEIIRSIKKIFGAPPSGCRIQLILNGLSYCLRPSVIFSLSSGDLSLVARLY